MPEHTFLMEGGWESDGWPYIIAGRAQCDELTSIKNGETSMKMRFVLAMTLILLTAAVSAYAQGRGAPPGPPPTPKTAAKIDLTGYWVSLVTEDWRYRQFTPPKGDYESVPINAAGKKIADGGIQPKTKRRANNAKPMAPPA